MTETPSSLFPVRNTFGPSRSSQKMLLVHLNPSYGCRFKIHITNCYGAISIGLRSAAKYNQHAICLLSSLNRVVMYYLGKVRPWRCINQFACYHDGGMIRDAVWRRPWSLCQIGYCDFVDRVVFGTESRTCRTWGTKVYGGVVRLGRQYFKN